MFESGACQGENPLVVLNRATKAQALPQSSVAPLHQSVTGLGSGRQEGIASLQPDVRSLNKTGSFVDHADSIELHRQRRQHDHKNLRRFVPRRTEPRAEHASWTLDFQQLHDGPSLAGPAPDLDAIYAAHHERARQHVQSVQRIQPTSNVLHPVDHDFHRGSIPTNSPFSWQEQFSKYNGEKQSRFSLGEEPEEEVATLRQAFEKAQLETQSAKSWQAEFQLAAETLPLPEITPSDLENDFMQTWEALEKERDGQQIDGALDPGLHGLSSSDLPLNEEWADSFLRGDMQPAIPELHYQFEANNPYMTHDNPYQEGLAMLRASETSLTDVVLALEAALQRIESLGLSDAQVSAAWEALGKAQQENEKEVPALAALQQAIATDPRNLNALLASAISYINENHDQAARQALKDWLTQAYPQIQISEDVSLGIGDGRDTLIKHFVNAAQYGGQSRGFGSVDPDVQVGLGVLHYANNEYQRAIDCFEAALRINPNDHVLWNRLGATLANSGETEAAIDAYSRAIALKPSYVRAHYNLGVGCMNIGCYKEAAEHFLGALSMHQRQSTPQMATTEKYAIPGTAFGISTTLWDTLRRAFYAMDRGDLASLAQPSSTTDLSIFRPEFDF